MSEHKSFMNTYNINMTLRTVLNTYITKYRIIRNYDFIVFHFAQHNTIIHGNTQITLVKIKIYKII